jgi:hypothetical protein
VSKLWRTVAVSAAACAVVAAGVGPAFAQPAQTPTVTISVKAPAGVPKLAGHTAVGYKTGKYQVVTVSGQVTDATSGMEAQLFAQPFPYKVAPAPVAGQALVLDGSSPEAYSFTNTPGIATKYSVEILPSDTVSSPVQATSAVATVYVVTTQPVTNIKSCNRAGNRPVCHESFHIYTRVPASAYKAESKKKLYFYWALKVSKNGSAPTAALKWLYLNHSVTISKPKRISATEYEQTVAISFRVNNKGYEFNFNFCTKGSESSDGVNLPGTHHCGASKVWWTWFLG